MTQYNYNSSDLVKPVQLTEHEEFLLKKSQVFCILPWIHLHAYPTGEAWPCCAAEHDGMQAQPLGNARQNSLQEIWNGPRMQQVRLNMLNERPDSYCTRCYEREDAGFRSDRRSANKTFGHHIKRVEHTDADGTLSKFEMVYWDIRFSNLCNLKCRSCGHIFSSQWYQDQIKLWGKHSSTAHSAIHYAGRTETDMWEQLEPHLEFVEQIYFAGGEPLLMEEHYRILDELDRRGMHHVRLIYNTNFTHTDLKGRSVFDYWKKFKSVAVGASLDAMGDRAELIRKGTKWSVIEQNRRDMLATCPEVDFYISPTLSIMNALHLPEFHQAWVEQGLIKPQDLNVNILQDPAHYRIDIAPADYKTHLCSVYQNHLEWLKTVGDPLGRATQGFESAVKFMMATDNTQLIDTFWRKTHELDNLRQERVLTVIPELRVLL